MTTILLTGKTGQVGRELQCTLAPLGRVVAPDHGQMDLTSLDAIRKTFRETSPDIIVNAAAYTAVDRAEAEPDLAMLVNAIAPGVMAEEARRTNALLVHYSTDYIFDGLHAQPYVEEDVPNPLNAYGRSKLEGERAIAAVNGEFLILRTSWIYSAQPPNFVLSMLTLAREKRELAVVNDQVGSPTWARALASATVDVLRDLQRARRAGGIYHLSAQGYTTRFDFARRIFETAAQIAPASVRPPALRPITTSEYPLPAARPLNVATSKEKIKRAFGIEIPGWEAQLQGFLREFLSGAHQR